MDQTNVGVPLSPLVQVIANRLTELIHNGEIPPGQALPSERQLADSFKASHPVVKRAVLELVARGLVHAAPRCKPVVSGRPERVLPRSATHMAAWLWPHPGEFGASTILKGIQSVVAPADLRLVVESPLRLDWEACLDSEARFLESVANDATVSGVILWYLGGQRNAHALAELRNRGVPTIFVDRLPPQGFEADFVGTDNRGAARAAVQHLLELGHRRISCFTNLEDVSSVKDRVTGYKQALRSAGIAFDSDLVACDDELSADSMDQTIDRLLKLSDPPTAIFAVNDHIALHVRESLSRQRIGRPMSLIGFDGFLRMVPRGGGLTTMVQNFERIGQLAAELLIERLDDEFHHAYRHVILDAPLFDGGSTTSA
jgi:DNA-binding LacI/PurR family transcriptional regulator